MRNRIWQPEEDKLLTKIYADISSKLVSEKMNRSIRSVYSRAMILGLKKSEAYLNSAASGRLNKESAAGYNTRYKKGQIAFNTGKKQSEYMTAAAIEKTKASRFKKGQLPHNTKHDGIITPRKDKSGKIYLHIRVGLGKWVLYHRHVWEQANRKLLPGEVVRFRDGNTMNCELSNLELIDQAKNMELNSIQRYPTEIKEVIRLQGKLNRTITKKQNHGEG